MSRSIRTHLDSAFIKVLCKVKHHRRQWVYGTNEIPIGSFAGKRQHNERAHVLRTTCRHSNDALPFYRHGIHLKPMPSIGNIEHQTADYHVPPHAGSGSRKLDRRRHARCPREPRQCAACVQGLVASLAYPQNLAAATKL